MPLDVYREWKRKNKTVGCVFARLMAGEKTPARYGNRSELVSGTDPGLLATEIADRVAAALAEPDIKALALVFPDVTTLKLLVDVASELAAKPDWTVTKSTLTGTPVGDAIAFHISRSVPYSGATIPSEVLFLGPFPNAFPNTRCAPVTAMEIYVGDPPSIDFMGNPTTRAHLALIDVGLPQKVSERFAQETKEIRLESLGGIDDRRAKAKVAFSVPVSLAPSLGCAL